MLDHHLLPPEIWLEVFRWATTPELERSHNIPAYIPFQPPSNSDTSDRTATVRSTLPLVCRQWKRLSVEFLYEDLTLLRGAHALKNVFDRGENPGRWVRRVVLPYPSTATGSCKAVLPSIEILRSCPNLETLVRPHFAVPEALHFHFDAEDLPLLSLRRLDWCIHNEAERTGGINSLDAVLRSAPHLQYLSVWGVLNYSHIYTKSEPLCLPELQILRLHAGNGVVLRQIQSWVLPALSRLIVDSPMFRGGLDGIWETFGSQLQIIEFGRHVGFLLHDILGGCLLHCLNLKEVNYHLFFTVSPDIREPHGSITTVGLHAAVNMLLQDEEEICSHLETHFEMLKSSLPALRRLVLYGEWRGLISHSRLVPAWQSLYDYGIVVEHASLQF